MNRPNSDTGENNPAANNEILPLLPQDGPHPDARENNPGPNDEIPPLSASLLGESSIPNPSNVQPTA
jgi:hypothetical protein